MKSKIQFASVMTVGLYVGLGVVSAEAYEPGQIVGRVGVAAVSPNSARRTLNSTFRSIRGYT